jgi:DNA-binding beta-propeller fold protein YncE
MNEETTVAAAYALAPFAADITHIGATGSSPTGLVNALTNAAVLANPATGTPGGASLSAGVTVPVNELNTLSNILAACVNTSGATSSNCTTLFTATGASETFGAALAMAKNPGAAAILALYNMPPPSSPFMPTLSSAPADFTVAVTSTGGGTLATPYGIAIDALGNAWVTNESSAVLGVTSITPAGAKLSSFGYSYLAGPESLAFDRSGNLWVANTGGNSVLKVVVAAGLPVTVNNITTGGISGPVSVALDSNGTAWVANFNGNSVTGLTTAGAAVSGSPFTGSSGNITVPAAVAVGPTGLIYVTSGTGSVVALTNAGAFSNTLNDGALQGPQDVAVDTTGRVLATGFTTGAAVGGALSEFGSGLSGLIIPGSPYSPGISTPAGVASDGTSIFVANDAASGGLAQIAYGASTALSPSAGYGGLSSPVGVAIDSSGSVWTTNSGSNTVSKFIGLAIPVVTPLAANVGP